MKPYLLKAISIALLYGIMILVPVKGRPQCLCSGGIAPNELQYTVVLNKTISSSVTIDFPKFDPSLGTLSCVSLDDTVSIESSLGIRNTDTVDRTYRFRLTINTNISGPFLSNDDFVDQVYGPDPLNAFGTGIDSINYGPDTLYNKVASQTYTSGVGPYLGTTGNVSFNYTIGGGVASLAGGLNFNSTIKTSTWGVFKLTYYWCENSILASGIKDFQAVLAGSNKVRISWNIPNETNNHTYEIQISENGKQFYSLGNADPQSVKGASAKYEYQYALNKPVDGKLYFRVKQTDGQITRFSEVRAVSAGGQAGQSLGLYPNPAGKNLNITFDSPLTGEFRVDLVNQVGQVIYTHTLTMNNGRTMRLDLNNTPPSGIYYLRAREAVSGKIYSGKLVFRR